MTMTFEQTARAAIDAVDRLDEPDCWKQKRITALDALTTAHGKNVDAYRHGWITGKQFAALNAALTLDADRIASPDWIPPRPGRRMPTAEAIARHWLDSFELTLDQPECFACRNTAIRWSHLERAHLVDRARDGLDTAANLVMLCETCHRIMPSFGPGEGDDALAWVRSDPLSELINSVFLEEMRHRRPLNSRQPAESDKAPTLDR